MPTTVTITAKDSLQPYVAEQQSAFMFELHCLATQLLLLELYPLMWDMTLLSTQRTSAEEADAQLGMA